MALPEQMDGYTEGLDKEIQRAIAEHDMEVEKAKSLEPYEYYPKQDYFMLADDEHKHLEMIADELKKATSEPQSHIPAGLELLATNTALAAYNALLLLPVLLLSNVHLAALPMLIVAPDYLPPRIQLLVALLPVLDNLALQLLRIYVVGPHQKLVDLATRTDTPGGAAYRDLVLLFEYTRRLYSEEDPFLTVEHVVPGMWKEGDKTPPMFRSREQSIELALRKVNLATFLLASLGTLDVGFFHLDEAFLSVLCPANSLDPENSLCNMSPEKMALQSQSSVVGEKVGKMLKQHAVLYLDLKTQAYISALEAGDRSKEECLNDIFSPNLEDVLMKRRATKILLPTETDFLARCRSRRDILLHADAAKLSEEYDWYAFVRGLFDYATKNMSFLIWGKKTKPPPKPAAAPHSQEALAKPQLEDLATSLLPSEIQQQQLLVTNPASRVTSRRPWTREEEKALRHALELKGPQWSTILELFGQGGRINEDLKNRTQVQLKDKARNWKMFFLKLGLPVPAYLQKVTGGMERDDRLRAAKKRMKLEEQKK